MLSDLWGRCRTDVLDVGDPRPGVPFAEYPCYHRTNRSNQKEPKQTLIAVNGQSLAESVEVNHSVPLELQSVGQTLRRDQKLTSRFGHSKIEGWDR